jgi:hypothetical protein
MNLPSTTYDIFSFPSLSFGTRNQFATSLCHKRHKRHNRFSTRPTTTQTSNKGEERLLVAGVWIEGMWCQNDYSLVDIHAYVPDVPQPEDYPWFVSRQKASGKRLEAKHFLSPLQYAARLKCRNAAGKRHKNLMKKQNSIAEVNAAIADIENEEVNAAFADIENDPGNFWHHGTKHYSSDDSGSDGSGSDGSDFEFRAADGGPRSKSTGTGLPYN